MIVSDMLNEYRQKCTDSKADVNCLIVSVLALAIEHGQGEEDTTILYAIHYLHQDMYAFNRMKDYKAARELGLVYERLVQYAN